MTQLISSQLATLRSRPQSTHLYLSIYSPKTIFQSQVTGSYSQGDNQISFYGTTTGSWWQIYPNMTARLGSTQGGNEYGDLRVRNASGTYIKFAENEVIWQQGMWLTCIDEIDIQAIYPKIIQDPANATNVIFYKDYDIPYSNQNTIYGTFPCAGPHRAGFIITGAYSTYYSSTGTYNVKGDSLTYSWAFEGGTPTGSTAKDPGFVRYTTPGHYKTRLIVNSSSGAVDTTYRYVSAYQRPEQGTFNPIEAWEISELSGSRSEGGYTARIKIMSILPEIQPNAIIVIFADDMYKGSPVSLGGNSQNNESIVFVGYILSDSIKFNYEQSTIEFDVGSVSEVMKNAEGFSISCESKASASTWYELTELTIQKALYHYLRWHSTVLSVNDFQYTNDDRYTQYLDTDRESLFDAIDNFMRNGLLGSVVSDRQGKLWAEISHFGLQTPFSSIPRNPLDLNKQDWMGEPTIQERRVSNASFVELGGIAYYGVTSNTFSALLSNAPGVTPFYHGKSERQDTLILLSQQQLNQVTANYLAYLNTQFNEVSMPINGNYRNIDIAPQEQFRLVISPADTIRNVSLQDKPYIPTSMSWTYSSVNQTFTPDITFEQMATGTASETVLIPATPPYQDSGYDYPSLQLPPLPVYNPSDAVGPTSPTKVLLHDVSIGLCFSDNFDAATPDWYTVNAGLTQTQYQSINAIVICPNGAVYVAYVPATDPGTGYFLARAPYVGGTFTQVSLPSRIRSLASNTSQPEQVAYHTGNAGDASWVFHVGNYLSVNNGATFGGNFNTGPSVLSWGNNEWLITQFLDSGISARIINAAGTSITATRNPNVSPAHLRAKNSTNYLTYHNANAVDAVIQGQGDLLTSSTVNSGNSIDIPGTSILYADCDPTGQYLMTRGLGGAGGGKARSPDFGATWLPIPNLVPSLGWYFQFAGMGGTSVSTSKWIAARALVEYTQDFGATWVHKNGTLNQIAPFPSIDIIRIVSA